MSDIAITFAIIAMIVILFAWGRIPVELIAIGAALSLWATGILSLEQTLAGFGDSTVIFIAALFVVSESLDASGVTAWAGQRLINGAGESKPRLLVLTMLVVAGLTAIVTVNAAVAALLPVVVVAGRRLGRSPSKLMIPLVFGAHAGSQLALTGSNVNLLIADAAADYGSRPIAFFEFALVGVPLLLGTIAVVTLFGDRLLPDRSPRTISPDLSRHARTLLRQYGLGADTVAEAISVNREIGLAEVVIPPRSPFVGQQVFQGMVTESGDLVVAAIQRKGEDPGQKSVVLAVGDVLLLQGPWAALDAKAAKPGVLAVDDPDAVRRQAVPFGLRAWEAVLVLAGMVVLLVTGVVPPAVAGLLAAGAVILLGILSMEQAYRAIHWTTVVLVAALLPLSTAMFETGAADLVGGLLIDAVGGLGPYGLLAGLFIVTAVFGQLISNTATALIMIPIGAAASAEMGVDILPVLMSTSVAAAASLLTPVATPVNLIAMTAAGYEFGDYWRLGGVVMLVFFIVAVLVVPIFWPF